MRIASHGMVRSRCERQLQGADFVPGHAAERSRNIFSNISAEYFYPASKAESNRCIKMDTMTEP
jgi:hypothetical protein